MNILLVNPGKKMRTEIDSLSWELSQTSHNVTILLAEECRSTIQYYDGITYEFFEAAYIPRVRYTLPAHSFYSKLCNHLNECDIIHPCSYFYLPCTLAAIVGNQKDVGVIITVDSLPGINWSYGNTIVDIIGRTYTATLGRLTFSSADRVVGLGEYLVDDLKQYVPQNKISIIPNGINTCKYSIDMRMEEPTSNKRENIVELLYVGRLDPVKGVPYLISAVSQLKNKSAPEYRLTIVGDGTKRTEYERQCEAAGIADRVRFEGWQDDVTPYYATANVLVLPSLSEGQPTVLLEAQAFGVPVVTTDVGGASALVVAGQVVPTRDSNALTVAIAEVGKRYMEETAVHAHDIIVESFSTEQMCAKYLQLYEEVLSSR